MVNQGRGRRGDKTPPKGREPQREPREGKQTLQDACHDLKRQLAEAEWARDREKKELERKGEDEALMLETYGPNWRQAG